MINYFNFKKFNDKNLLTNDFGHYIFLEDKYLKELVLKNDVSDYERHKALVERGFITETSKRKFIEDSFMQMRYAKGYLHQATSLFIFVMTNVCNMSCLYCQAQSEKGKIHGKMSFETAEKAVDIALMCPSNSLSFEFQGGEPLINFDTIKHIIEYTKSKNTDKQIEFNLVSNLTLITDEMAKYLTSNHVRISVSLDGDLQLHNTNRRYRDGSGTYEDALRGIKLIKKYGASPGAIQTTTRYSLSKYKEIIDTYVELGFRSIFLRPLTPLGYANETWDEIGYSVDEFMEFYKNALNYILELNKNGIYFTEGHAQIMLNKIINGESVNYMELRSPCGAGLGQMAFYYNGNVFTCDEGRMLSEMGNDSFKLGNVYDNSYGELIESSACKAVCSASYLESLPVCGDCVYNPYCGVCPVINLALEKDLISKKYKSLRCGFYKGILDSLFKILYNEKNSDACVLRAWVSCEE